jgi:hypothetical protein
MMSYRTRNNKITVLLGTAQFLYHRPTNVTVDTVLLSAYVQTCHTHSCFCVHLKHLVRSRIANGIDLSN